MIAQLESEKQEVDKLRDELKKAETRMTAQAAAIAAEKEDAAKRSALLQGASLVGGKFPDEAAHDESEQ